MEEKKEQSPVGKQKNIFEKVLNFHKEISEETLMFKSLLPYLNSEGAYNNLRKVMEFFQDRVLAHFNWEETEVFPLALAVSDLEFKKVVRDLQQQHIVIIGKLDILNDIIMKHGFSFVSDKVKDDFIRTSREMIEIMLQHSRTEDTEFYPFLKEKDIRITEIK